MSNIILSAIFLFQYTKLFSKSQCLSRFAALFSYLNGGDNMGQTVLFDYFYGGQSDAFSYYRIPRLLITGQQFKGLSTDAKLLYGLKWRATKRINFLNLWAA